MAITATPTNLSTTHRDGIRAAGQIYGATLAVTGAAEVGSLNSDGAAVFEAGVTTTGITRTGSLIRAQGAPTSLATAGAATYTIAQLLTGIIVRDCAGAGRTDVLPTAALLVAGISGCAVGDTIECLIINGSDAAETLTIDAGSGGGYDTNQTAASRVVPQNSSKLLRIRVTDVTASSEAYVAYL